MRSDANSLMLIKWNAVDRSECVVISIAQKGASPRYTVLGYTYHAWNLRGLHSLTVMDQDPPPIMSFEDLLGDPPSELMESIYGAAPSSPRPGDGKDYPVIYVGTPLKVDEALLTRCKIAKHHDEVFQLNESFVMKVGRESLMTEAKTMRLVAQKTSIPWPKVRQAYLQEDQDDDLRAVIIMEAVQGETLDKAWPFLGSVERADILGELKHYLWELRTLQGDVIGAVDQSSCVDPLWGHGIGPFGSEADFHGGMMDELASQGYNKDKADFQRVSELIKSMGGHEIVLTHNDLFPRNIVVKDGKVEAIIGWELCDLDYWEYVKMFRWDDEDSFWLKDKCPYAILEPKEQELENFMRLRSFMLGLTRRDLEPR